MPNEKEKVDLGKLLACLHANPEKVEKVFPEIYNHFLRQLIKTDPEAAYWALRKAGDKEGLRELGRRSIKTNPEIACRVFEKLEDKEGLNTLLEYVSERTGVDYNKLRRVRN
jgi:hypothetical protein